MLLLHFSQVIHCMLPVSIDVITAFVAAQENVCQAGYIVP
jgi:hypothetical protein